MVGLVAVLGATDASEDAGDDAGASPAIAHRYWSTTGDDEADGCTPTTAVATYAAAVASLPVGQLGVIHLDPGITYSIPADVSIEMDISKVALRGNHTILRWEAVPTAGYGVWLYGSKNYGNRHAQWGTALDGVIIQGSAEPSGAVVKYAASGLRIGHATHRNTAMCSIRDGGVLGWRTNVEFLPNAWRINLEQFNSQWGDILVPASLSNFGEAMTWRNSIFADYSSKVRIATGEWFFEGCSFDNVGLIVNGDCSIHLTNHHLENPGSGSVYRYIDILHPEGEVFVSDSSLLTLGAFDMAPFRVAPGCTTKGLVVNNLKVQQYGGGFTPEATDGIRMLVAGGGRAVASGITSNATGSGEYAFSESANLVYNGDASAGNTGGWTATGTGTLAVTTTPGTFNRGAAGFQASAAAHQTVTVTKDMPVQPGRYLMGQMWRKGTQAATGNFNVQVLWLTPDGLTIGSSGYSTAAGPGFKSWMSIVPAGCSMARLQISVNGGNSGASYCFDDVVFNLV
jgi:hypothetical protein